MRGQPSNAHHCRECGVLTCKHGICVQRDCSSAQRECPTCKEHQIFKAAADKRKERGVRLQQFRIMCDSAAVVSLNDFFSGWCDTLGKDRAVDFLIVAMRKADEGLRAALERRKHESKDVVHDGGITRFVRTSAPRLSDDEPDSAGVEGRLRNLASSERGDDLGE